MRWIVSRRSVARGMLAMAMLLSPVRAHAAGGAHAVDDAGVETPGQCHLESWISDQGRGETLANASPACTARNLPTVEIGATIQHVRMAEGRLWLAGPAIKWAMRGGGEAGQPAGVALAGAILFDARSGRLDSAGLLVPVTFAPARRVTVNLNLGAGYVRGDHLHALYGAQLYWAASDRLGLMMELYGRPDAPAGVQAGLRRTFNKGRMDLDVMAGRSPGHDRARTLTLGLTVRR